MGVWTLFGSSFHSGTGFHLRQGQDEVMLPNHTLPTICLLLVLQLPHGQRPPKHLQQAELPLWLQTACC